jgi:hypothetical protein
MIDLWSKGLPIARYDLIEELIIKKKVNSKIYYRFLMKFWYKQSLK